MTRVILAHDDGPVAGMGHRRRMEALRAALRDLGAEVEIARASGATIVADVVVLDSYRWRADDSSVVQASLVVALDDLDRDLAVDIVVDPNPGANGSAHTLARRVLAGASYALVDPSLARLQTSPIGIDVAVALVTAGGGRTSPIGIGIATQLAALLPSVEVIVALPPNGSPAAPGVRNIRTSAGLGPAMAMADLVVTASGVTLLEALALGRPTVAMVVASNQQRAASGVAEAGAAVVVAPEEAAAAAAALAADAHARRAHSAAAVALVDGQGARRVARACLAG